WRPRRLACAYARLVRGQFRGVSFEQFDRHGAWRNAWLRECLPSGDRTALSDVTEKAGYGWRFFRGTARSRTRRALLPLFGVACGVLRLLGLPPSPALAYFNIVLEKSGRPAPRLQPPDGVRFLADHLDPDLPLPRAVELGEDDGLEPAECQLTVVDGDRDVAAEQRGPQVRVCVAALTIRHARVVVAIAAALGDQPFHQPLQIVDQGTLQLG